jgi:hypothetical protein
MSRILHRKDRPGFRAPSREMHHTPGMCWLQTANLLTGIPSRPAQAVDYDREKKCLRPQHVQDVSAGQRGIEH